MPERPKDLVFFDLETSGLRAGHHEITELCGIKLPGELWRLSDAELCAHARTRGNFIWARLQLAHPDRVHPKAAAKNGYDPQVWAKTAKPAADVLTTFAAFAKGCTLAGHNVALFDIPMLRAAYRQHAVKWPRWLGVNPIDSLILSRQMVDLGLLPSCSLAAACQHFGIVNPNEHRAGSDALAAARYYNHHSRMIRSFATAGRMAIGLSPEARARFEATRREAA